MTITTEQQLVSIFDPQNSSDEVIKAEEFDIVSGYFKSINKNKSITGNFTTLLFWISNQTKIPVLTLLEYIKGKSALEMTKLLAYYINSLKSKTILYGITSVPRPNQVVARNILH